MTQFVEFMDGDHYNRLAINPDRIGGVQDQGPGAGYTKIILDGVWVSVQGDYQMTLATLRAAGSTIKVILDEKAFETAPADVVAKTRRKK